ncbi:14450_t:CDS:10 [Acaulospora morrowiae]|uniref:14450_t:CDS:1 n=1 Tax=Acaulospora morrowiae TaxID=94023 RepID=A0A9N8YTP2_9GLOM|nr:14450_t:CDS:10 [Acaulospora morrowiae]
MKHIDDDSPSRRSPRLAAKQSKRNSLALQPTRSCLRRNDDTTTNFDLLQEDNTNLMGITCENTATFTLRNFDDTGTLDENGRRRKSLGRRVSFAATAHVRLFDKDEAADDAPAASKKPDSQNEKSKTEFMLALPGTPSPNASLISNNDPLKKQADENNALQVEDLKPEINCVSAQQKINSDEKSSIQDEEVDMTLASLADRDISITSKESLDHENGCTPVASQDVTNTDEQDMSTVEDMSLDELDMSLVDISSKEQKSCTLDFPIPIQLEINETPVEHTTDMLIDTEKDMLIDQNQMHSLPVTEIFDMSIVRSENDHDSPIRISREEKSITEKQLIELTDMSLVEETQMMLEEDIEMSLDEEDACMSLSQQSCSVEQKSPEKVVSDVTSEELRFMNEAIDEQNAQIQIFENELENLKNELQHLQNHCTKLKSEKSELIQASGLQCSTATSYRVDEAKRLIQDNKCFTENDLRRYQEQYESLQATHKWRPQELSGDLIYMIYDNSLQIKIDLKAAYNQSEENKSSVLNLSLYELMLNSLLENKNLVESPLQINKIPKIFKYITSYWQKVKQFNEEIHDIKFKFPIEIIAKNDSGCALQICLKVLFFNYEGRSKFFVNFLLRPEAVMSYPNLEKNIDWQVQKSYGNINENAISNAIKTQLLSGNSGCIKAACVEVNKKGFAI